MHLEFSASTAMSRRSACNWCATPGEKRLYEIIAWLEAAGCPVADPHTYILEDGGMKTVDDAQLAFRRQNRPARPAQPRKDEGVDRRAIGRLT